MSLLGRLRSALDHVAVQPLDVNAPAERSLDVIGVSYGADQSSLDHDYLKMYEAELGRHLPGRIVMIANDVALGIANTLATFFSTSEVFVLFPRSSRNAQSGPSKPLRNVRCVAVDGLADIHRRLTLIGPVQVMIEDGSNKKSSKLRYFNELFFHLDAGGVYVVEDLHASYIDRMVDCDGDDIGALLSRLMAVKAGKPPGEDVTIPERAAAIFKVTNYGKLAFVTKTGTHLIKLHEPETTEALEANHPRAWGRVVASRPAREAESRATASVNRAELGDRLLPRMSVPELFVRAHEDVVCSPQGLAVQGRFVLPTSFHHPDKPRLRSRAVRDVNRFFCRPFHNSRPVGVLRGTYFHADSEFPRHYGHFTTEVLSKFWAWDQAKRELPDLKVLVSTNTEDTTLLPYQKTVFDALGIPVDDVVVIDRPTRVERLVTATQGFRNPTYIAAEVEAVWARVRDQIRSGGAGEEYVFVGRGSGLERVCKNARAVEELFERHGFTVVHPETLPLREQVDIFASARVVAGFGGSGLVNTIYSDGPGVRIVITSESYYAMNEYLISSIKGDEIHYFWCPADVPLPEKGWNPAAFHSDFTFDFERDGPALEAVLRDATSPRSRR